MRAWEALAQLRCHNSDVIVTEFFLHTDRDVCYFLGFTTTNTWKIKSHVMENKKRVDERETWWHGIKNSFYVEPG